ncbi:MAG TPA: alanyl-tRNA editing protein [Methylomirabilota bacterium]|nr:alanyl-tRNA editing protein [Methylomirabilota bacterium]
MPYFCHEFPDVLTVPTRVVDARPGAVVLERTPFHPGGGGQLADRGVLRWQGGEARVTAIEADGERFWHVLGEPVEIAGAVEVAVDAEFRALMAQLHTNAHVISALVFQRFAGALITGAQLNADGTARVDFDLPEADNERLRALEPEINDVIRQDLDVRYAWIPVAEAAAEPGLLRSRSVTPPPSPDGRVRIVEIVGLDRQACGGTHLASTGRSRPVRILKIDNKGRHNRRVRLGLAEG